MIRNYPPGLAAFAGIISLLVVYMIRTRRFDVRLIYEALVLGGKNSLSIGSIVACIGIILALVGLTGIGLKLSWFITEFTRGVIFFAILIVGLISMILGMGLATGPSYIILAIMAGPALNDLGFPLLIAHMIMIWFSVDSMITPPVGLSAIAAASVAGSPPVKTMLTAFKYAKALYILPFMFYYRPAILLQGPFGIVVETVITILLGHIAFTAFWENFLFRRTNVLERFLLLLATVGLLAPHLIWNGIGFILFSGVALNQKMGLSPSVQVGSRA
jgi:TRAP-type uncharacterized transport system fused permease subunit